MPTATLLDLGPTPATPPLPGAPPSTAAGVAAGDFALALSGLLTGPVPVAAGDGDRQAAAASGKVVPVTARASDAVMGVAPPVDCELTDFFQVLPDGERSGADTAPDAARPEAEGADLPDPGLEPALAWLLPPPPIMRPEIAPVPTPVSLAPSSKGPPPVAPADRRVTTTPVATPSGTAPAGFEEPPATISEPGNERPQPAAQAGAPAARAPNSKTPAFDTARPVPADPASPNAGAEAPSLPAAIAPATPPRPAAMQMAVPNLSGTAARVAASADRTIPPGRAEIQPAVNAGGTAPVREAAAVQLLHPVRTDAPAMLTAAVAAALTVETYAPATSVAPDATVAALAQSAAPGTVAPAASAQQAGIDLTRDPGLHQMIDRIEQLRDGADVRETRIRLIPDALGPVDIAVRREGAGDAVRVHFTAPEAATRQLIAEAQPRLTELAEARGIRIERASIGGGDGGAGQFWSGQEQARPQPQQAQFAPGAPARAVPTDTDPATQDRIA